MTDDGCKPPADEALAQIFSRFPDAAFLALGQTALWDEPTKASLRRRLDECWPDARLIAAVHDTDYFAKLPGHPASAGDSPFAIVDHNDHSTRGLWSAAGEMSRLFGSEDVPSRAQLATRGGIQMHRALKFVDDPDALLAELTRAWGWTGIIQAGWEKKVVAEIDLDDILPTLLEQIDDAIVGSAEQLSGERAELARELAQTVKDWVSAFAGANPDATLPDLYRDLLPRFYGLLLGDAPKNFSTSQTTELLRFNRTTASLPRFAVVGAFLDPKFRAAAKTAYDRAVAGSGIYALDDLGDGALPFDLVIPGRGRGTLHVQSDGAITIDASPVVVLDADGPIHSTEALAARIEDAFGPDTVLVGKAVSLLPMLSAEFVLIFHEGASGYSDRSGALVKRLLMRGVPLPQLRPILRVKYATWDSLSAVPAADDAFFVLPEHLRQAKGRATVAFDDFAGCWRRAMGWEKERLREMASLRTPRLVLQYLVRTEGAVWAEKAGAYEDATASLLRLRELGAGLIARAEALQSDVRVQRAQVVSLQRAKGDDFRARTGAGPSLPIGRALSDEEIDERVSRFDTPIDALRGQIDEGLREIRSLKAERLALERGDEAMAARTALRRIEAEAERARARQTRRALQSVNGLPHTDFRPSSWWFPLVDPSGAWFARVAQTAEFYLEPLTPEPAGA